MTAEPMNVRVDPESELAQALAVARDSGSNVLVEVEGKVYRLTLEQPKDIWAGNNPEKAIEALDRAAGSWSDIDPDALKTMIYRAREEGTRPLDQH
ncbi:MAG: hypothetical protein ACR2PL_01945 [Dehalococcoidia bacterium]